MDAAIDGYDEEFGQFNFDNYTFDKVEIVSHPTNSMIPRIVVDEDMSPSLSPRASMLFGDVSAIASSERFSLPRKSPKRKPIVISNEDKEMLSGVVLTTKNLWSERNVDQVIHEEGGSKRIADPLSSAIKAPTIPTHRSQYRRKSFEALSSFWPKTRQTIECDQHVDSSSPSLNGQGEEEGEPFDPELLALIRSTQKVHERREHQGYNRPRRPSEGHSFLMRRRTSSVNIGRKRSFTVKENELSGSISRLREKLPGSWPFHSFS